MKGVSEFLSNRPSVFDTQGDDDVSAHDRSQVENERAEKKGDNLVRFEVRAQLKLGSANF